MRLRKSVRHGAPRQGLSRVGRISIPLETCSLESPGASRGGNSLFVHRRRGDPQRPPVARVTLTRELEYRLRRWSRRSYRRVLDLFGGTRAPGARIPLPHTSPGFGWLDGAGTPSWRIKRRGSSSAYRYPRGWARRTFGGRPLLRRCPIEVPGTCRARPC